MLHVVMDDGATLDIGPNEVFEIPAGHDKWVTSDEPWVAIEWGASSRAMVVAMHETSERTLATVTALIARDARLIWAGDVVIVRGPP